MEDKHDWIEMTRLGADEKDEFTGKLHWDQERSYRCTVHYRLPIGR